MPSDKVNLLRYRVNELWSGEVFVGKARTPDTAIVRFRHDADAKTEEDLAKQVEAMAHELGVRVVFQMKRVA